MLYGRCVVTTKFLYRPYHPSRAAYESGCFRLDPAWARNSTARSLRRWELASADRLRRIGDVEKHFRPRHKAALWREGGLRLRRPGKIVRFWSGDRPA